jgi:dienelactone hydrolase
MKHLFTFVFFLTAISQLASQIRTDLFNYDKKANNSGSIVQSQQINSATIFEKIVLKGFDSKIPFYHFKNNRNDAKNYIILLHGLSDSKSDWVYPSEPYLEWSKNLKSTKDSLISLGYSLIIPDAKFHGERSYELEFRPAQDLPPLLSKNEKDSKLFEVLMTSTVKDVRIIMDYLQFRFEIPDMKFSIIGYSMGGAMAILLNASDDRISSIVACVPPLNHPEKELEGFDEWSEQIKKGLSDVTPSNYSKFQKSPILLLMGKRDFFYTENEVSYFIENVPTTEKELKYFDSGHILPNEYKIDAIRWITKHNNMCN